MTDFFDTMSDIKKHVTKSIYRTVPSHSGKQLPKWKKYKDDMDLSKSVGMATRIFDVVEEADALELVFTCSGVDDYNVLLNIEICYPNSNKITSVAFGDYTKIKGELLGSTNIELANSNFGFFKFEEPILDDADDEAYRILTIPLMCRISVGLESTIEQWNIGANGIDVRFV